MAPVFVAASDLPAAPVLALMALGVVVAIFGHIVTSRKTVITGIAMIFLATALMMVGAYVAFQDDDSDPRPRRAPGEAGF